MAARGRFGRRWQDRKAGCGHSTMRGPNERGAMMMCVPERCMRGEESMVSTNSRTCSAQKKTYSTSKYARKVPAFGHVKDLAWMLALSS